MKYFIFRNNTTERLFKGIDATFSGYDDISYCPDDAKAYIWFYQAPLRFDNEPASSEILSYIDKLKYIVAKIPVQKTVMAFTISDLFSIKFSGDDFKVKRAISQYNEYLVDLSKHQSNVKVIDLDDFLHRYEENSLIDWRFYFISQMILNPKLADDFSVWFAKQVEIVELKRKKCLVLDLDNTLWGGVLGEDGIDGIKIGGDYPGKAFLYFQEALIELSKTGVILTVCSKNNETDVLEAWEKNPFIVLNKKYISAYRINWNNKADNIRELAEELNIGLDSFVFIDDNPTERELIKQMLPMVSVPDFPEQPYLLPSFFKSLVDAYFKVYTVTDEDKKKTEQYKANAERANEQRKFSDFSDYLRSLDIHIDIMAANDLNIPRIAQMTQKTNQFNLTTKRYTDADIHGFVENGWRVYCIGVADKFGDNGITGAVLIKIIDGTTASIDSLLLSCRILGKGIENVFINSVLRLLKNNGIMKVYAEYLQTLKNNQVSDFYDRAGFSLTSSDGNAKSYSADLNSMDMPIDDYYKITIK